MNLKLKSNSKWLVTLEFDFLIFNFKTFVIWILILSDVLSAACWGWVGGPDNSPSRRVTLAEPRRGRVISCACPGASCWGRMLNMMMGSWEILSQINFYAANSRIKRPHRVTFYDLCRINLDKGFCDKWNVDRTVIAEHYSKISCKIRWEEL